MEPSRENHSGYQITISSILVNRSMKCHILKTWDEEFTPRFHLLNSDCEQTLQEKRRV